ncbi:SRPBCC family protein [Pseudomonas sp. PDNC002]|uniref:SRPBCC family protein n=1 Tax=Pseudomonas sp. PDNC002 TaxID=2811422 RepID=UPI0019649550|nr:SRPBCC family protein [Pseudomonas sp. PDNC002]QRY77153.1 SRPBCC family protein [Pseudomonas sp. PDNC002]
MLSARHELILDLPHDAAWTRLRDLSLAPHYVPGLTGCDFHPGPREGLGASRRVHMKRGFLDESVVEWNEGRGLVLRLHRAELGPPFPFREASFRYALLPEGDARTRLVLSLDGDLSGGRLGEWLLAGALRRTVAKIALNLKAFYETGKTQNADYASAP